MFSPDDRRRLRRQLIEDARADSRISAAALVGSAALDREDRFSDIDLALRVETGLPEVIASWTARLYGEQSVITHLDVDRDGVLYRVFLLPGTLQLDLSFWPAGKFAATGPAFRLLFGEVASEAAKHDTAPPADDLVGTAWLYALHLRSSIARRRHWQAVHMLAGLREVVITLLCRRHDLPDHQGRGVDELPEPILAALRDSYPTALESGELQRAFAAAVRLLLGEIGPAAARRLEPTLEELVRTSAH